jgi:7,8-dihydroneopterin aldolase/epimerase/oxygenase
MADRIEITGLRVHAHHGVLPHERELGQVFVVDLVIELDLTAAAASDDLADTVHYGEVAEVVVAAVRERRFDLIEALAGHLAEVVLDHDARSTAVEVAVRKPAAPLPLDFGEVAVRLRRERR